MRRVFLKPIIVLAAIVIFLGSSHVYSAEQIGQTFISINPQEAVKNMSPGWNLGDALDGIPTEGECSWCNPPVEEDIFDYVKKAGFKTVRIPVTWAYHIGPAPDYKVDPQWMDRVEQVVDWALKRDFYVIIDAHHDSSVWFSKMAIDPETGRYVNDYDNQIIKLEELWRQIAERFNRKNEKLIFEIVSEPLDGDREAKLEKPTNLDNPEVKHNLTAEQMNDLNRRILRIIRASGGYSDKRLVMVCGLSDDSKKTLQFFDAPNDKYIILTVHYYEPWDFISNWWGRITWGNEKDKQDPDYIFRRLGETFVENRLPVVIGEWSTSFKIDKLSRWYYHNYIVKTAYKYGIPCVLWDNGKDYFDRQKRIWRDETIKDIVVNAGLGIPNSFVFPADNYFREKTNVEDLTVKLELNGNELVDIYNGEEKLVKEKDYVSDTPNSSVTINKNYLSKLLESEKTGVTATLKFDFSQGTDIPVDIIKYDLPKFSQDSIIVDKTKGEIESDIVIPVSFNGTKLATVGVVDEATKKSVVYSWTPYLQMNGHFDYNDKEIILKKRLLNLLKSDSLITFEFYPRSVKVEMKVKVLKE